MLMPYDGCADGERVETEYTTIRSTVGIAKSQRLPIDVPPSTQPCTRFGVHPRLPLVRDLYQAGEASFVANIGPLIEPISNEDFRERRKPLPPSLYAHNIQTEVAHSVEPSRQRGVLARMLRALGAQPSPYSARAFSFAGNSKILAGAPRVDILTRYGVTRLGLSSLAPDLVSLLRNESGNVFAETASSLLVDSLNTTESLTAAMSNVSVTTAFPNLNPLGDALKQAATVVAARDVLKSERGVFFVQLTGFDTHGEVLNTMDTLFGQINAALDAFVTEMKRQGVWNETTILSLSEFGRALTPNSGGTDHGWGGHHFLLGGGLKGRQIHGRYPPSLAMDAEYNIGGVKPRSLPTTPWEALWSPVAQWFGLSAAEAAGILPNARNFPASTMLRPEDVYQNP
eukprot:TRINITY_DN68326_c0_g1_i1.p1 TRINITY_DN68326_c0_g1~~TRINITY_DN68326_c0_g1_i1.p1  ORF type:complete len:446 (+),score=116.95 TRINITY_DN68326_c0_g1_i1:142-1338(+)